VFTPTQASIRPQEAPRFTCLSLSGATDEAAKILADKENTSNILEAHRPPASLNKDPKLNQILLDLMQNNSMKESFRFADMLLNDLKDVQPSQICFLSPGQLLLCCGLRYSRRPP